MVQEIALKCNCEAGLHQLPWDNWKTLSVNPAVNVYHFQISEG